MEMDSDQSRVEQMEEELRSFLNTFEEYAQLIFGGHRVEQLDKLRSSLQRREPLVTRYILETIGDGVVDIGSVGPLTRVSHRYLLATAVRGGATMNSRSTSLIS